jgi:kynureninase
MSESQLIEEQRAAFNVPRQVAYFNTAAISPQLGAVRRAGDFALDRRARPWEISDEDWFTDVERLRSLFAQIIGASAEGVAIVPATSYGLAVAARNLRLHTGRRVLVLAEEYPSGIYTWRAAARRSGAEILTVSREAGQTWTDAVLAALDESVAIVSLPNVHWTDGALVDLDTIAARCRELGARLAIDGSQSVGAMPIDVSELRPDFLVTAGYKWLLGPFSVGFMYVAEEHRQGIHWRRTGPSARAPRTSRGSSSIATSTSRVRGASTSVSARSSSSPRWRSPRSSKSSTGKSPASQRPSPGRHPRSRNAWPTWDWTPRRRNGAAPTCSACAFPSPPARWRSRHSPRSIASRLCAAKRCGSLLICIRRLRTSSASRMGCGG